MRRFATALIIGLAALTACSSDDPATFEVVATIDGAAPGDIISLRADGEAVEFINRRAGEIRSIQSDIDTNSAQMLLAQVDVSTEGEQRGLLGHTVIDDRRFAAWTDPDTLDLVVGEVTSGTVDRIVWTGTGTQATAIGGHLETRDGLIVLGLGSLTDWAKDHGSGALVTFDPDGTPGQEPIVISDGWNNPFAFIVSNDGTIWVADNSPDGSDLPVEEREGERIATISELGPTLVEPPPQRAPSAIVNLPDGRLGVCGFLDNEMRAYDIDNNDSFERAGTVGPCLTGAAVLADGGIVTASTDDAGNAAIFVRNAE